MIAINLDKQRIYIRGDILEAYRWVCDYFDQFRMMSYSFPFTLDKDFNIIPHKDWTIEHNPEPLYRFGRNP